MPNHVVFAGKARGRGVRQWIIDFQAAAGIALPKPAVVCNDGRCIINGMALGQLVVDRPDPTAGFQIAPDL